jgi:hypothetical protein
MQHLKLLSALILSTCLLFACSGNSSTSASKDSTSNTTSDNFGSGVPNGNGSFSYTIEGTKVSVKSLYINEVKNNVADRRLKIEVTNTPTSEVFNFSIANSGTTTVLHYSPSLSNIVNKKSNEAEYMSHKYKNYYGDSVIVSITDMNATHVAGTFTGKFLSDDNSPLEITDGSFDLPFTKEQSN